MTRLKAVPADGSRESEGLLWKPKRGATASFEKFLAARETFLEIHRDSLWNPWVNEERAGESERAIGVMGQWTRAEPSFRQMTDEEFAEMLADSDRESEGNHAAKVERWDNDKKRYDPERETARLALIEHTSRLGFVYEELEQLGAMEPVGSSGRTGPIAELQQEAEKLPPEIERLKALVGDPEGVVDAIGQLPHERRSTMLFFYQLHRQRNVRELRKQVLELKTTLKSATDKTGRSKLRTEVQAVESKLEKLLAVPPLGPEDMCSECATPASEHGWVTPPDVGPCPQWPGWGARLKKVHHMLLEFSERSKPAEVEPPKPQPLAVIPSGLAVAEVIEQLTVLHAEYPDAVVKRGRSNRWELWPADHKAQDA